MSVKDKISGKSRREKLRILKKEILSALYRKNHHIFRNQFSKDLGYGEYLFSHKGNLATMVLNKLIEDRLVREPGRGLEITDKGREYYVEHYAGAYKDAPMPTNDMTGPFQELFPDVARALKLEWPEFARRCENNLYVTSIKGQDLQMMFLEQVDLGVSQLANGIIGPLMYRLHKKHYTVKVELKIFKPAPKPEPQEDKGEDEGVERNFVEQTVERLKNVMPKDLFESMQHISFKHEGFVIHVGRTQESVQSE